jgi:hypothetical protein
VYSQSVFIPTIQWCIVKTKMCVDELVTHDESSNGNDDIAGFVASYTAT